MSLPIMSCNVTIRYTGGQGHYNLSNTQSNFLPCMPQGNAFLGYVRACVCLWVNGWISIRLTLPKQRQCIVLKKWNISDGPFLLI